LMARKPNDAVVTNSGNKYDPLVNTAVLTEMLAVGFVRHHHK